ncbi:MAG: class I SAM-dependent methyltransferase [Acidimicrobiales bacterium]
MLTIDLDRAEVTRGSRVLDLGCGSGRHSFAALLRGAHVIALDRNRSEVAAVVEMTKALVQSGEIAGSSRHAAVVADMANLPFTSSAFDRVFASEVFEHLPDDERAMGEVARITRSGGCVAITVPRAGPERANWLVSHAYHEVEGGHVRIYRRRALVSLLRGAGLRVLGSHHAHALHSPYWLLRCVVGVNKPDHPLVRAYHRMLVWDITHRPVVTRALEHLLNPVIGKSLVIYAERPR